MVSSVLHLGQLIITSFKERIPLSAGRQANPESYTDLGSKKTNIRITYFLVVPPTHLDTHVPGKRVRSKEGLAFVLV